MLPLFAFANAGVPVIGISAGELLHPGVGWGQLYGASILCGVGGYLVLRWQLVRQ